MTPPQARIVEANHPDKVNMLVLETDDPHPDTREESGTFGDVLAKLFKTAGETHVPKLGVATLIQYIVEDRGGRVPKPEDITDDIQAILITGSCYDAHGDVEWVLKLMDLIRWIWINRPDIRFSGICFGHQILCRTLGAVVRPQRDGKWEISHTAIDLTDIGRALFNLPADQKHIHLHEMHLDHVVEPPRAIGKAKELLTPDMKVHVWGTSEHTAVQGCFIPKRMFTSQGHMEFSEIMVKRQLEIRVDSGALNEEDADEASLSADMMHDGLLVAQAVLRFFRGDDDTVE